MRFSVWPSFQREWTEVLELARRAEAQGWDGIWFPDHYMADDPKGEPSDEPALECWSTLAALGAAAPRLQLGSLVSPSTVHHPALLAHQATTVDMVSGGRLVLGIGAGWQVNEHKAYGWELPPPKARVDRFAEFIEILHGLLHDKRTTFAGKYFSVVDAPCEPKGATDPVPILVGTGGPRMLRLTARWAQAWNVWGTPERVETGPPRSIRRAPRWVAIPPRCAVPRRRSSSSPMMTTRRARSGRGCPLIGRSSAGRPSWSTISASTRRPASTS